MGSDESSQKEKTPRHEGRGMDMKMLQKKERYLAKISGMRRGIVRQAEETCGESM